MKKVIKILLSIILLLFIVFILAGLVKPAVEYTNEITVDRPLEEVWIKFNDLDQLQEWIPEIISISALEETADKLGSKYEMVVEDHGNKMTMIETITEYVVNEKVALRFDAGNMIKTDLHEFTGSGNSTTITSSHVCKGDNYIHKCMFAFFGTMFKKIDQGYLDQFKTWAESN